MTLNRDVLHRQWSADDRARLIELVNDGLHVSDIATAMQRTRAAVNQQCVRLRLLGQLPPSGNHAPARDVDDWSTKHGAERLATRIKAYWAQRGVDVTVWVEPAGTGENVWFCVKSNIRVRIR